MNKWMCRKGIGQKKHHDPQDFDSGRVPGNGSGSETEGIWPLELGSSWHGLVPCTSLGSTAWSAQASHLPIAVPDDFRSHYDVTSSIHFFHSTNKEGGLWVSLRGWRMGGGRREQGQGFTASAVHTQNSPSPHPMLVPCLLECHPIPPPVTHTDVSFCLPHTCCSRLQAARSKPLGTQLLFFHFLGKQNSLVWKLGEPESY
jgi:hypothetical protein